MKAIIFGASGQDGQYLSRLLEEKKIEVTGVSRKNGFMQTRIFDSAEVSELVKMKKPGFIFHLAANSVTGHEVLFENQATIVSGTLNILEAVSKYSPDTKVFISGSGLQFRNTGLPIRETDEFEARDAYSLCRIQSTWAARYYMSIGISCYVGYFFNHDSPLRNGHHMTKKIAEYVKRIASGSNEKLEIGDLEAVKEYSFAGDIVKGVWTLVNQDTVHEANISTGKGYSIREWLELCFSSIGKKWEDHVIIKPGFTSPYRRLVSDPSRIYSLGWKPEVYFEQLAQMMLE